MNDVEHDHCRRCGNSYQEQLRDLRKQIEQLEAENEKLRKQIGDLKAAAVWKGLMKHKSFTGKSI